MKLYRIVKTEHIASAWSGYGAQQFGGRWNHPGRAMVYTASSISLAMLEILVHLQKSQFMSSYSLLSIEIPDKKLLNLDSDKLSRKWNTYPALDETMDVGDKWLEEGKSVGLIVPSVIIPLEKNVVLNPAHPDFSGYIKEQTIQLVSFDSRLIK
ncbi:RES family NAD+ phosphorylase [Zophobihabitans entericus]|uniref:RES domain-containing protein n=1 Tax=Zophobihabitans entericus TaxID=1635327 RepID=A0A6G9IC12_9GAMM|nr:RES domain-containing protein [Zophobihabitans entericus]QIQ21771.1 RES domain-containing protein [Zophobihabitans entericus]